MALEEHSGTHPVKSAQELWNCGLGGMVLAAAAIRAQDKATQDAGWAAFERRALAYKCENGLNVPIALGNSAQDASPIDQHRSRRAMAMARACRPRCLPRPQPGHGVAVCRGARPASSGVGGSSRSRSCRSRRAMRSRSRPRAGLLVAAGTVPAGQPGADRLGPVAARMGRLPLALRPSPSRPLRHADGAVGPRRLVLPDGHGTWRRPHALAGPDAAVPCGRYRRGAWAVLPP